MKHATTAAPLPSQALFTRTDGFECTKGRANPSVAPDRSLEGVMSAETVYTAGTGSRRRKDSERAGRMRADSIQRFDTKNGDFSSDCLSLPMLDCVAEPIFVKDISGRYLYCNEAASRLTGIPRAEIIGQTLESALAADDWRKLKDLDSRVVKTGAVESQDVSLVYDGSNRTFAVTKSPWRDPDGTIIGICSVVRDITAQRDAEIALQRQNSFLEQIAIGKPLREILEQMAALIEAEIPSSICGILLVDRDGKRLRTGACGSLPDRYSEVVDGIDINPDIGPCPTAAQTGESIAVEDVAALDKWPIFRNLALDCGLRACFTLPIRSQSCDSRTVLGTFAVYFSKPTTINDSISLLVDRVKHLASIAIESDRTHQELRSSEARFRCFVDNTTDAFFMFDEAATIVDCSTKACEYLGYTRDELIGQTPELFDEYVSRNDANLLWKVPGIAGQLAFESVHHRKDGTLVPVDVRVVDFEIDNKKYSIGTVRDITDSKLAEIQLRESTRRLAEAQQIAGIGSWSADPHTGKVWWSDSLFDLFGIERGSIEPGFDEFLSLVHPDDRSVVLERSRAVNDEDEERSDDIRVVRPNGDIMWINSRARATRNVTGEVVLVEGTDQDITERKRVEQKLEESQRYSEAIIQATPECIKILDSSARLVEMNNTGLEMIAAESLQQVAGQSVLELVAAEHRNAFVRYHERICSGESGTLEFDIVGLTGQRRSVESHAVPLDIGSQRFHLAVTRDVTERNRANVALRLASFTIDHASLGVIWIASDRSICDANPTAREMLGYSQSELKQLRLDDIDPDIVPSEWEQHWTALRLQRVITEGRRHRRKDGSIFCVEVNQRFLSFDGQNLICAFVQDTTDRHIAEAALRNNERRLRLFRTLIDSATDFFEVIDPDTGDMLDVNQRSCEAHGYTYDEFMQLNLRDIDTQLAESGVFESTVTRVRNHRVFTTETMHRRKDGSEFPVEVNAIMIRLDREYLVAVVRDITERVQMEQHLRQSQKMDAVGRLAGGVAHDFNNLLTVINGYAELLLAVTPTTDERREQMLAIHQAGSRAAGLTAQLLAFSRKTFVEPKVVDINEVVKASSRLLVRLIREDVRLVFEPDSNIGLIKADAGQIEQAIMNLVVNSRDAMPDGGTLTIRTCNWNTDNSRPSDGSAIEPGSYVCLELADTGCGMTEETAARIFEPFFTTKDVGKGTGLGLAVVHGMIKQLGGHISVTSEPGSGTCFRLLFPTTHESPANEPDAECLVDEGGIETVLIVEDENEVRCIASTILKSYGFDVLTAKSGAEALQTIADHPGTIDVLLTDVVMPEMGGAELARIVHDRQPDIRIVFMSGHTDDSAFEQTVVESGDAFLQKPFTGVGLLTKIRSALDSRQHDQN